MNAAGEWVRCSDRLPAAGEPILGALHSEAESGWF